MRTEYQAFDLWMHPDKVAGGELGPIFTDKEKAESYVQTFTEPGNLAPNGIVLRQRTVTDWEDVK